MCIILRGDYSCSNKYGVCAFLVNNGDIYRAKCLNVHMLIVEDTTGNNQEWHNHAVLIVAKLHMHTHVYKLTHAQTHVHVYTHTLAY